MSSNPQHPSSLSLVLQFLTPALTAVAAFIIGLLPGTPYWLDVPLLLIATWQVLKLSIKVFSSTMHTWQASDSLGTYITYFLPMAAFWFAMAEFLPVTGLWLGAWVVLAIVGTALTLGLTLLISVILSK